MGSRWYWCLSEKATKTCTRCHEEKSPSEFYRDRTRKDGLYPQCRKCAAQAKKGSRKSDPEYQRQWRQRNPDKYRAISRRAELKRKYGITVSDYEGMYAKQEGRCAICKKAEEILAIDHCHDSGRVRGLLCKACNRGIGMLQDSPELLESAVRYLKGK